MNLVKVYYEKNAFNGISLLKNKIDLIYFYLKEKSKNDYFMIDLDSLEIYMSNGNKYIESFYDVFGLYVVLITDKGKFVKNKLILGDCNEQ